MVSRITCLFCLFFLSVQCSWAQSDYVVINAIHITGNKKTKDQIILREMDLAVGDTVALVDL